MPVFGRRIDLHQRTAAPLTQLKQFGNLSAFEKNCSCLWQLNITCVVLVKILFFLDLLMKTNKLITQLYQFLITDPKIHWFFFFEAVMRFSAVLNFKGFTLTVTPHLNSISNSKMPIKLTPENCNLNTKLSQWENCSQDNNLWISWNISLDCSFRSLWLFSIVPFLHLVVYFTPLSSEYSKPTFPTSCIINHRVTGVTACDITLGCRGL